MTKVRVESGICGFKVLITAEKLDKRRVRISVESECEMVNKMAGEVAELDMMSAFTGHPNNPVYRAAGRHIRHLACPVPPGIIKAVEAELGLCIPKDAAIIFVKDE